MPQKEIAGVHIDVDENGYLIDTEQWSKEIAIELDEAHPDIDPKAVNFVDLRNWVMALEDFDDDPDHSGEKILEAIQMNWIEERE